MGAGLRSQLVMALAWLVFPMVPVMLEETYYQICVNFLGLNSSNAGPDPRDWGWGTWVMMLGPLIGYGFLAGSTAEVPDDVTGPKRGLRRVVARRAVWVAVGPWIGFLLVVAALLGLGYLSSWFPQSEGKQQVTTEAESWASKVLSLAWLVIFIGIFAYGWLWPAWSALRRAARISLWRRALFRGVVTALVFVGSLFGSFWAITSVWRSFFFDPRVMPTSEIQPLPRQAGQPLSFFNPRILPMIAIALGLMMLSGCTSTITYGEVRRRELFHSMLLAWMFGMALIWWWSSRRRRRGPRPGDPPSGNPRSS